MMVYVCIYIYIEREKDREIGPIHNAFSFPQDVTCPSVSGRLKPILRMSQPCLAETCKPPSPNLLLAIKNENAGWA